MAGMMYLGNQKVTPVIIQGSGEHPVLDMYDVNENGEVIPKEVIDGSGIKIIDKGYIGTSIGSFLNYYSGRNRSIITEFNFPDLEEIATGCFDDICYSQRKLVSFNLEKLKEVEGTGLFRGFAYSLVTVARFTSLEKIGRESLFACFLNCNLIEHIYFNSLNSNSFGGYTDNLNGLVQKRGGEPCIIHFPSNLESLIEQQDAYPTFGSNTQLAFDLPATE